jgi:anhydro-N-acetylmuramic acid kinase
MNTLERLFRKKIRLVIGLMSGTSADGLDAVLVRITGSGSSTRIEQLMHDTFPFPRGYRTFLLKNSEAATAKIDEIARLDMCIAMFSADAVARLIRRAGLSHSEIDLIGSHGQTIHHCPEQKTLFGKPVRATFQIGNPSAIAKLTGIVTVGDFRAGDIAAGGTGAPLVPLFDYLMIRSNLYNRAALNIGGIANITLLPKRSGLQRVEAFDTGPGNMVIDSLTKRFFRRPFDRNGEIALAGRSHPPLLRSLLRHPYLLKNPPKSTGRELFGEDFIRRILSTSRGVDPQDIITTVTEFTALSIHNSYLRFIRPRLKIDELIVSGGGVHNRFLMETLRRTFDRVRVRTADELGIPSDAKEAICFALLANETIAGHPGNIPRATGAARQTILGTISLP